MDAISELLQAGSVSLDIDPGAFDVCLELMSGVLGERLSLSSEDCARISAALRERERLAATNIGNGVAVPHAYVDGVPRVMLFFARLRERLEHGSGNGEPVDLVFMLVGPQAAQAGHLPLLARLVRLLHDQQLLADLRGAHSAVDVLNAVLQVEQRHA